MHRLMTVGLCGLSLAAVVASPAIAQDDFDWLEQATPPAVQKWLDRGADLTAQDEGEWTPLHRTARHKDNPALVVLLLDRGTEATVYNAVGRLPVGLAQQNEALEDTDVHQRLAENTAYATIENSIGWRIIEGQEGDYFLSHIGKQQGKNFKIVRNLGRSSVTEVRDINDNYQLIIYISGVAGTSNIVEIKYAAIYDRENNQILGHYGYEYKSLSRPDEIDRPVWRFLKDKIIIEDDLRDIIVPLP